MYGILFGLVNMNACMNLQTSLNADFLRVRMEGRVIIRMDRTTAYADLVTLAQIAKRVGLRYTHFTFSKSVDICKTFG